MQLPLNEERPFFLLEKAWLNLLHKVAEDRCKIALLTNPVCYPLQRKFQPLSNRKKM
ncbi:hypothetical protein HMPREF1869_00245 [Bacteroidales bacterium KA00251]|nr:hypothetical protein HMPREF1869_00245 [Bacteroidales bacterium KA00251]